MPDSIEMLDEKTCKIMDLDAQIPHGIDFTYIEIPVITAEMLDGELKRRGIWTESDLRHNTSDALAAIQSLYGITLSALLQYVAQQGKE